MAISAIVNISLIVGDVLLRNELLFHWRNLVMHNQ